MANRYRATLAYDGTAYQGFQRQIGDTPTIQLVLENAICAVTQQTVTVTGAGRTDAGVHAAGQVIAFDVEWYREDEELLRAINANLPQDIALQDIRQHPRFHPRFDALSRVYTYTIANTPQRQPLLWNRAWHIYGDLDVEGMQRAAKLLIGEHDFATFGRPPYGDSTIRKVMVSEWAKEPERYGGSRLIYRIEADAFLQHMVRRIVATLVEVGRTLITLEQFEAAFSAADLSQSGPLAPSQGLVLETVRYP
jgi:tRNA pseudouridine38-40 synthase